MDCLNYSVVLVLTSFTMLLSANSSNILEHSLKYLSKYNDMNLESIITMCEYGTGGTCGVNSVFGDDIWNLPFTANNTLTYTWLTYGINTTDNLVKLLSQSTPTVLSLIHI